MTQKQMIKIQKSIKKELGNIQIDQIIVKFGTVEYIFDNNGDLIGGQNCKN